MKTFKTFAIILLIAFLSNIPPIKAILQISIEGIVIKGTNEYYYVTNDHKFIYSGSLRDTLKNSCYIEYKRMFPKNNHVLYRIQKMNLLKFWHWSEYIFEEKWHQPYLYISNSDLNKILTFWSKTYHSPNGTLSCEGFPDK